MMYCHCRTLSQLNYMWVLYTEFHTNSEILRLVLMRELKVQSLSRCLRLCYHT